jgi:hypothetical protein
MISIDDLCNKAAETSSSLMEFDTSEQILNLGTKNYHRFADIMYLLAQNQRYKDLFENLFVNSSGKPIIYEGDRLSSILSSIKDDKLRGLLALYSGEAISGFHGGGAIKNILELDKPVIAYSKTELQDLQTRLECISMIPISKGKAVIGKGEEVHLALSLSGEPLIKYKDLLKVVSNYDSENLNLHSYQVIGALYNTYYNDVDLASVINSVTEVLKIKESSTNRIVSKAISTGKKERVGYVRVVAKRISQVEEYAGDSHFYFSAVSNLIDKFIGFKDDKVVRDLVSLTTELIDSGIKKTFILEEIGYLARNCRIAFGEDKESLTEEQLGERTKKALKSLVALQSKNLPDEVYVAYNVKGGKRIGFENFSNLAINPKVVDTFNYMSKRNVPEYAKEAMANVLIHGDQKLAEQTAETVKQLVKIGSPKQVYKRLDTKLPNKDKAYEGMRAIGEDRVIRVLKRYRGQGMGSVAGVFVNALYHNPEIVDGWVYTLKEKREEILQMSVEDRLKLKEYFGVEVIKRKEFFSNEKLNWVKFQGKVNSWLNDYKKV